jgi:hypothetical protein
MPVVSDLHHFHEKQDADPDPHQVKGRIQIRIKVQQGNGIFPTLLMK